MDHAARGRGPSTTCGRGRGLVAVLAALAMALGLGSLTVRPAAAADACVDLRVSSISASPSNPVASTDVTVLFTIQNAGTCATPPEIGVSIGTDLGVGGCCVSSIPDLGPGQSTETYAATTRFPQPGAHEAVIVVDPFDRIPETDETNNRGAVPVSVQPATIDLVLTDVRFEPARPVQGRPMKAVFTVRNVGSSASKPFTVDWLPAWNQSYRSAQGTAVPAGGSTEVGVTYTYASYWNFDSSAEVRQEPDVNPESDYTNNARRFQVPVDPPRADLVVQGVHVTPSNPQPGQAVTAAFVVKNTGNTDAGPFQLRWQPSAQAAVKNVAAGGLAAGARRTLTFTHTFATPDVFQGTATVDPLGTVAEIEEGNNVLVTTVPVAPHRTDLKVVAEVPAGTTVRQGVPFPVDLYVSNLGDTASGPFSVAWNPDTTGALGPGNRTLTRDVLNLDRGESRTLRVEYTYWKAGTYQSLATVDAVDRVVETSDRNNQWTFPVTALSPDVDLRVTGFTLGTAQPTQGRLTTAAITVKNTGTAPAGPFVVQWRLPAGSDANPRAAVRSLAPGESRTLTFGGTFADAGSATTSAVVDVFHQVAEPGGEGNNTASRTVTVQAGG